MENKKRKQHLIEVKLIPLRLTEADLPMTWNSYDGTDPFILYQEGKISKRKLISIIARGLSE